MTIHIHLHRTRDQALPVALDPDLLYLAQNAEQQNIIQDIYRQQAERDRLREWDTGDKDFVEGEHPRDQTGQFTSGSGSQKASPPQRSPAKPRSAGAAGLVSAPDRGAWPAHIKKLVLPPAWTDVRISMDPKTPLQAIGVDAKGRHQYVYSQRHRETQAAQKFKRIKMLEKKHEQVVSRIDRDLGARNASVREHAQVASLILDQGMRPGSTADRGGDVQAYGATTLLGSHVKNKGRRLEFVGKKGVNIGLDIDSPVLAKTLADRASEAGAEGQLFPGVTDSSLRDYIHKIAGAGFKAKDFRTLKGTSMAHQLVQDAPTPKTKAQYKKQVKDIATQVAAKLGNTPTVALQSYISPLVFAPWLEAVGD